MFIRFFKTNQPASLFAVPFVVALLWLPAWFRTQQVVEINPMPLFSFTHFLLSFLPPSVLPILGIALISFQGMYFNYVLNEYEVLYRKSYLPALFFIVLSSASSTSLWLHPSLFAACLLIPAIAKIFSLYKNEDSQPIVFDIGFLLATAVLFYFPSVVFILVFYVSLVILRPFVWREWLVPLIGFSLPLFFCWIYFFLNDRAQEYLALLLTGFMFKRESIDFLFNETHLFFLVTVAFLSAASLLKLMPNFFKNVIRTRNYQQTLLFMIPFTALPMFLSPSYFNEMSLLFSIPLCVFISYYFLSVKRNWWLELLFILLISSLILLKIR